MMGTFSGWKSSKGCLFECRINRSLTAAELQFTVSVVAVVGEIMRDYGYE